MNKEIGMTVYSCEKNEKELFNKYAEYYGVKTITVSEHININNVFLSEPNSCVSVSHKSKIDDAILSALKKNEVECILTRSIGCDHIDLKAAEKYGITVRNVTYSPDSVADYTLLLILMIVRNIKSVLYRIDKYDFTLEKKSCPELRDLTIGVIGTGKIGQAVIRRLNAFGCNILAFDTYKSVDVTYTSLERLLCESDIITLHIPLTEGTYHIIDHLKFNMMKDGAVIINTGRGALIDTRAMIHALRSKKLGGAALDVIEGEEDIFYQKLNKKNIKNKNISTLCGMENVILTPHTAFYTDHALCDIIENTIKNCVKFERGIKNEQS